MDRNLRSRISLAVAGLCLALLPLGGCAIVNHLMYVVHGATVPAEFAGLVDKRVAVVCISANDDYGPDSTTVLLSREVERLLQERVKKIRLVRHQEVANWIDRNDWQHDYLEIGRGVKADLVVAVDLGRFSLYEGSTLFKGHADVQVSVYDMSKEGASVFSTTLYDYSFPSKGAQSITDVSEAAFKRAFIKMLAQHVARSFYEYDIQENVASDPAALAG
jgi:hypothetical protein